MNRTDYYRILGVSAYASDTEIKQAYFKLAKELHPDLNKAKDAKDRFSKASEAYETLSDKRRKEIYDSTGMTADEQDQAAPYPYESFEDLSERFAAKKPYRGEDIELSMGISFKDSVLGCKRQMTVRRKTLCSSCKGTCCKPGTTLSKCHECDGFGSVLYHSEGGTQPINEICRVCKGDGIFIKHPCNTCQGAGVSLKQGIEAISFPSGVSSGHSIILNGKGHTSQAGGPSGDLLIKVVVLPHATFRRSGQDIISDVVISKAQADAGATLTIQTLYGPTVVKIESGTQSTKELRIAGYGVPYFPPRQQMKGDHIAVLQVKSV
jgi:molecular chaperone DnaJ